MSAAPKKNAVAHGEIWRILDVAHFFVGPAELQRSERLLYQPTVLPTVRAGRERAEQQSPKNRAGAAHAFLLNQPELGRNLTYAPSLWDPSGPDPLVIRG